MIKSPSQSQAFCIISKKRRLLLRFEPDNGVKKPEPYLNAMSCMNSDIGSESEQIRLMIMLLSYIQ